LMFSNESLLSRVENWLGVFCTQGTDARILILQLSGTVFGGNIGTFCALIGAKHSGIKPHWSNAQRSNKISDFYKPISWFFLTSVLSSFYISYQNMI
jgi:hypothetical protein